jgi:carbon storage regulator
MLVLTRRSEESIVIGGNIVVTILSVEGEKVKLGIEAPREIAILRKELIDVIQHQIRLAGKLSSMADPPASQSARSPRGRIRTTGAAPAPGLNVVIFRRSLPARCFAAHSPDPRYCVFSQASRSVDKVSAAMR